MRTTSSRQATQKTVQLLHPAAVLKLAEVEVSVQVRQALGRLRSRLEISL